MAASYSSFPFLKWVSFDIFTIQRFPIMSNSLRDEASSFFGSVERLDPALDALVDVEARAEDVCAGFIWSEGPVWKDGALFFSDVPANVLYRWRPGSAMAEVFLEPSGGILANPDFVEPGSNGLALDPSGRLLLCQSGGRRVVRLEADGHTETVLADRFEGRRFNNPNDLVCHSSGAIYFSDPSYGFKGHEASRLREMPWNGVYRIAPDGPVDLLIRDLSFPNGVAFSPDEKTLYIAVSDAKSPRVMAFEVQADGLLGDCRLFFDAVPLLKRDLQGTCDGLKVDSRGNVFATAPGGIAVLSPHGKLLGTILLGVASNCAWGDDGGTLYITADDLVCRIKTATHGTPFRFP